LIGSCIDQIFTEDESWVVKDVPKKEVTDFLEQMNSSQFKLIEKFFETMPKLSHEIKVKNPNTGVEILSCWRDSQVFSHSTLSHGFRELL